MADGFLKPEDLEPEITGFEFYLEAFKELSTSRPAGLGLSPIPFTAIHDYFKIYELQDFDEFTYVIRRMDYAFLDMNAPAQTASPEGRKNKNAPAATDKKDSGKGRRSGR